ncbi:MAG: hypothetical protein ABEH66_05260 [Halobacteriales archaeon]
MGLFDRIELPVDLSLPGLDADPSTVEWQTKTIDKPALRRFRLTRDGRLLQEETHGETVPEEARPYYGTDKWDELAFVGSIRTVHEGWTERRYHGIVEFHASLDERFARYEARFTDGRLTGVRDVSGEADGDWTPAEMVLPETDTRLTDPEAARLEELLGALTTELDTIEDDDRIHETRESIQTIRAYLERRDAEER